MIAIAQRALVLLLLLAAAAWLAWARGHGLGAPWQALGVAVLLAPHALVLALEVVLHAAFGADPRVPAPRVGQRWRAWAGEVLASWQVFGWRQPFRAGAEADVPGRPGATGVVLVHGLVCNRGLWSPWLRACRAAGVPCLAPSLEPVFGSIDRWVPAIDAAVRAMTEATGRPPWLVGHSMGGLAIRAWLAAHAADERIAGVVTIATPHRGTWMARLAFTPNARQMRQGSAWLQALAAREPAPRRARFTCYHGHADSLVFPASTATLPGADNRHLEAVAHVAMVAVPEVLAEVIARAQGKLPPR